MNSSDLVVWSKEELRFVFGPPPEDPDFLQGAEGWKPFAEPSPLVSQMVGIPLGILSGFVLIVLIRFLGFMGGIPIGAGEIIAAGITLIPAHELIHAFFHPGFGGSGSTLFGFWGKRLVFFARYRGEMSRDRRLTVALAPFLILTFLPVSVMAVTGKGSGFWAILSVFNSVASAGDLLVTAIILFQAPRAAILRDRGWETFWKLP